MKKFMYDFCIERHSASAPEEPEKVEEDRDSGILSDVALLYFLVRYALFFPPLSLRQRLPRLGQLESPPKLLRRFLRGCTVATAHGLVTAPASVYVDVRTKMIWSKRIVARVMSGFVMREEGLLQAAAAARIGSIIEDEIDFIAAGQRGRLGDMLCYLIADDANCESEYYWG